MAKSPFDVYSRMLKTLKRKNARVIKHAYKGLEIMVQLTWLALPCSILFVISIISFNYWLSILTGSSTVFLIIALFIKIGQIDNKTTDTTRTAKKIVKLEHQIEELEEVQVT